MVTQMPNAFAKWLLSSRIANPLIGHIMRVLGAAGWYAPIVAMSRLYISWPEYEDKRPMLLALMPERFRGDLEALENAGYGILRIYSPWMSRIIFSYFRLGADFDTIFTHQNDPLIDVQYRRLSAVMVPFLRKLSTAFNIDAVISAATHYGPAYLWGSNSKEAGTPFIVLHRECLHASPHRRDFWTEKWSKTPTYKANGIIVQNETARQTFIKSKIVSPDHIYTTGALRMDGYIDRALSARHTFPESPQVTFFSFTHASGLGMVAPHWSAKKETTGFAMQFEKSHGAFARFAAENPHISCIVKVKWLHIWQDRVHEAAKLAGVQLEELTNFRITEEDNPHDLIISSSVVCGFGSTTLLEAALAGRPVVVPLLGEALDPTYQDKIILLEDTTHMVTAFSEVDFIAKISAATEAPTTLAMSKFEAMQLFKKWVAPTDGSALIKTCNAIEDLCGYSNAHPKEASNPAELSITEGSGA